MVCRISTGASWHKKQSTPKAWLPPEEEPKQDDQYYLSDSVLALHGVICGSSGAGKTHLLLKLIAMQLMNGRSIVMVDIKEDTLMSVYSLVRSWKVPVQNITAVFPSVDTHGVPAWNILDVPLKMIRRTVDQFVSLIRASTTSWGPRLQDILGL